MSLFLNAVRRIVPFMWAKDISMRFRLMFSFLLIIFSVVCNLYVPIILKKLIDLLADQAHKPMVAMFNMAVFYGLIWLCSQISIQARNIVFDKILLRNVTLFTLKIFEHLLNLPMEFHANKPRGELLSSIEGVSDAMFRFWNGLIVQIFPILMQVVIATVIICQLYGLKYGVVLLITVLLYILSNYFTVDKGTAAQYKSHSKHLESSAYLLDALQNYELIKGFNNEKYELNKCANYLEAKEKSLAWSFALMGYVSILQMSVVGFGLLFMTIMATNDVVHKNLQVGDFVLLNGYLLQFSLPLSYFGYVVQGIKQSFSRMQSIIDILDILPSSDSILPDKPLDLSNKEISFNQVYFGYNNREQIIQDLSFTIAPRTTLAIVGKTGCGKSSLVKLLLKFYEPNAGAITIDGINVKEISSKSLRAAIAVIPQDTAIFDRSIYENVIYGNPSATQQEVAEALRAAHLDEFIATLPDGVNTIVGEKGIKISGGERQRIAIARAILKKASFYIFDEATSSLDLNTERIIQNNLAEISQGVTTLIIAHRLSTIIHANLIIVIHAGKIAEHGTHLELLQLNGIYANLWFAQQQKIT